MQTKWRRKTMLYSIQSITLPPQTDEGTPVLMSLFTYLCYLGKIYSTLNILCRFPYTYLCYEYILWFWFLDGLNWSERHVTEKLVNFRPQNILPIHDKVIYTTSLFSYSLVLLIVKFCVGSSPITGFYIFLLLYLH